MSERLYVKQLTELSESQNKQLLPDGLIMACLRELSELNREL